MAFKMKPSSFKSGKVQGTSSYRKASAAKKHGHDTMMYKKETSPYTAPEDEDVKTELIAGEDYSYYGGQEGRTDSEKEIDRQTRGEETEAEETKPAEETKVAKKDPYAEAAKRDPNLGEYVKLQKSLEKGSNEWNKNQNKINKAYGIDKRHPVTEVGSGPTDGPEVGSGPAESTDSKKGREVTRDYDKDTGTSTKTVTRDGDTKREVVKTGQETQNRGDDTTTRTRYTKDGGKVVTEKDALNRTRTRYDADGNITSGGETKERGLRGAADRIAKRFSKEGREAAQEKRRQERVDKGPTIIQARKQRAKQRREAEEQAAREAEEARRIEEGVGPAEETTPIDTPTNEVAEKELITKKQEATVGEDEKPKDEKPKDEFGKDERDFSDELTEERGEGDIYMEQQEQARLDAEEQAELEASDEATDDEQLAEALAEGDEIVEQAELEESDAAADEEALADQAGDTPGAAMEDIQAKFEETGRPPIYDDWAEAWEQKNPGMKAPSRKIFQGMFPAQVMDDVVVTAEGPKGIEPLKPTPINNPGASNNLSATTAGDAPEQSLSLKQQVKQQESFSNFRDLALELETAEGRGQSVTKIKRKMMEARQKYIDAGGDPSKVDMRNLT
tara:strand:+ start:551 stop:2404 length:1854 start_codon:yes stop_codon:yes gene_type:complete